MARGVPVPRAAIDGTPLTSEEFTLIRQSFASTPIGAGSMTQQSYNHYFALISVCERQQPDNLGQTYRRYLVTEAQDPRQAFILAMQFLGYSRSFAVPRQS